MDRFALDGLALDGLALDRFALDGFALDRLALDRLVLGRHSLTPNRGRARGARPLSHEPEIHPRPRLGPHRRARARRRAAVGPAAGTAAPDVSVRLPWWVLAAAFVATEACVVHIHFRRSAHSFTLGEIPLVLGLLFAAPADVVLAWVVGSALVLAFQRGIPRLRVAFNVAQIGATAGLAGVVFVAVGGGGFGPQAWAAARGRRAVAAAPSPDCWWSRRWRCRARTCAAASSRRRSPPPR